MYGGSFTEMDERIRADKKRMEVDSKLIEKLQAEVDSMVQKSLNAALKWRGFEQNFNMLRQKIEAVASRHQVDINSFVKLNVPQYMISQSQQLNNGMVDSQQQLYGQHSHYVTGNPAGGQQAVSTSHGYGSQGVQPRTTNLQVRQYQKPVVSQAINQPSHLSQITQPVSKTHTQQVSQSTRSTQHGSQQPLKIINNTTDKNFNLQQNVRGHYQNQAHAEPSTHPRPTKPPVTKSYKSSSASPTVQSPPKGVGNTVAGYNMRRPPSPTSQPPSQAVGNAIHFNRRRSTTNTTRTSQATPPTNYWGRQSN